MQLEGRVAIVTGSGRGIGRAIAEMFAREGSKVVVSARTEHEIQDVAKRIVEQGGEAIAVPTDITREGDVERLVARTTGAFGQVDILVNNAAVNHPPIDIVDMQYFYFSQIVFTSVFCNPIGMQRLHHINLLRPIKQFNGTKARAVFSTILLT